MMATVWLAFNGLDVLVTYFALRLGAVEANPVFSGLTGAVGEPAGYGLKLLFALVVAIALYRSRRVVLFRWLNLGMAAILIFNFGVLAFCLAA
jgi:hypothetical protein